MTAITLQNRMTWLGAGKGLSPAAACLMPLLTALSWRGNSRQLAEALTNSTERMDITDLRNTLANLDYKSWTEKNRTLNELDARLLPCLFLAHSGKIFLLTAKTEATRNDPNLTSTQEDHAPLLFDVYDATHQERCDSLDGSEKGTIFFFSQDLQNPALERKSKHYGWFFDSIMRFKIFIAQLLGLTMVLNLLALAPPLFVMAVYDQAIANQSEDILYQLAIGVMIALAGDALLRTLRGTLLAYLSGRIDMIIGVSAVERILDLPLPQLERSPVGQQMARLKEFESIRSFFVGPLALAVLELPFALIFLSAIAWIGGWLALLPLGLMLSFGLAGFLALRAAKRTVGQSVNAGGDCQGLLVEILSNIRGIKADATEAIWQERFRNRSAQLAEASLRESRLTALVQTFSQFMMISAGAGTLALGSLAAMEGNHITVGALIACMALVWRVLAPMQMLFLALTRMEEIRNAVRRLDQLMAQPTETLDRQKGETIARGRRFAGRIRFSNVLLRYAAHHDPALAGVSFDITPGSVVAITGPNGSGKSSILKLMVNLYQPQIGAVFIDGVDVRQINPIELRQSIGYLPQDTELFAGTVADNLRLADPVAEDAALAEACACAGILDDIEALPQGFHTVIGGRNAIKLSTGFKRGLAIARTYLTKAPILLFDEPATALDQEADSFFLAQLESLRGRHTVVIVTHRPSHIRAADRVIVIARGGVTHDGPPEALMDKLYGAPQK